MPIQFNGTGTISGVTTAISQGGTTSTSAVDITLTNASTQVQNVTMTAADKSVILPNATTLGKGQNLFTIFNNGAYVLNVKDASGNVLYRLDFNQSVSLASVDNSTSAGNWNNVRISFSQNYFSSITSEINSSVSCTLSPTLFVIGYRVTATNKLFVVTATLSGGVITWGTPVDTGAGGFSGGNFFQGITRINSTTFAIMYGELSNAAGYNFQLKAGTVSSGAITVGTALNIENFAGLTVGGFFGVNTSGQFIVAYKYNRVDTGTNASYVKLYTVSGTTITLNQTYTVYGTVSAGVSVPDSPCVLVDTDKFLLLRGTGTGTNFTYAGVVFTVSGTTWTQGTPVNIFVGTATSYLPGSTYSTATNSAFNVAMNLSFTVSGTSVSFATLPDTGAIKTNIAGGSVCGTRVIQTVSTVASLQLTANNVISQETSTAILKSPVTFDGTQITAPSFSSTQGIAVIRSAFSAPATLGLVIYTMLGL
jgi:hypothetical protein